MMKKRCLFCDEIVPTKPEGDYDRYLGCSCSPDGSYSLLRDSYESINSLPHPKKRSMLHIISAYLREQTDRDEAIVLSANDLETIVNAPTIPVTIEDKGIRLLQYLYRHSDRAGESVVIHPLSSNYNLTYSPNLQELVYIIDKLRNEQLIIREGTSFQLTEQGWHEAAASAGGKKLKPCAILIANDENLSTEWQDRILPIIEQYGYLPRLLTYATTRTSDGEKYSLELIADSKLIIADLTGQSPEVYFAAGYALGLSIPVIWSMNSRDADTLPVQIKEIRPIVWNSAEELASILQQRLT
ncbi:hypothetical protein M3201_07195 [Paenibacillus motobuensis]|uniref:hypothetical protein n=1 Tax=Paenibacillus TaxID=44249 RepID=UPI0020409C58|nr:MULTISPECIES: hypothetical protein [Paenibacillus]MCM3039484.1 hypothetical protein [Paenibacillus lutimineralis]MCM3646588.1 hypothetical protein [Paenibacillus motobuensis]